VKYHIAWDPAAELAYEKIWEDESIRDAVRKAIDAFEKDLEQDPLGHGESRPRNRRMMFHHPLGIVYRVIDATRIVRVVSLWRIDRRPT
jgi:hypothetical protein